MENLLKLLEEYGLKLEVTEWDRKIVKDDFDYLQNREPEKDALAGFLKSLGPLIIKVKDYTRFKQKIGLPEKFNRVGLLVEKNVCVLSEGKNNRKMKTFFIFIEELEYYQQFVREKLEKEPEFFGVDKKEIELKSLFEVDGVILKEVHKIFDLLCGLCSENAFTSNLAPFEEELKEVLKDLPDDPKWYFDYVFQKNENFRKFAEKMSVEVVAKKFN